MGVCDFAIQFDAWLLRVGFCVIYCFVLGVLNLVRIEIIDYRLLNFDNSSLELYLAFVGYY